MKVENRDKARRIHLFLTFAIMAVMLLGLAFVTRTKISGLLTGYMEKQVTEQARTTATTVSEQFSVQFYLLRELAESYADVENINTDFLERLDGKNEGISLGILTLDGDAIVGEKLSPADFSAIRDGFRGNESVSFNEKEGLLFTVPIYHGENIRYVLYKRFSLDSISDAFSVSVYSGKGSGIIEDVEGQVIVGNKNDVSTINSVFNENNTFLRKLEDNLNVDTATALYYEKKSDFAYIAEVSGTDFFIKGIVDKKTVSAGVEQIVLVIYWVFGLLIVLFGIGIICLFGAQEKALENDELRQKKEYAENANKAKSDFLANMSHEIRTPINAVMGMSEVILRENQDPAINEYATNIKHASINLLSLINDILDFSKIEAGKMELEHAEYEFANLINDVVTMIEIKAEQKNLKFIVDVDQNLPTKVVGDEIRVRQVMVNILNNAVKYTDRGSVRLEVSGDVNENNILNLDVKIMDTGIGIRDEDIDKLFQDFERVDIEKNRNIEGTGLGLAITDRLVKKMNGELTVESEYGKGSVFTIYLQQEVTDGAPIGDYKEKFRENLQAEKIHESKFVAPDAKILVVDDNKMNLAVVKHLLKPLEIQVDMCMSGEECLRLIQKNHYDMIFLDHMMPVMDGIETLSQSKNLPDNLCVDSPVIALTANAIVGAREEYINHGFTDYLSKPIDVKAIEKMLRNYLPKELVIKK